MTGRTAPVVHIGPQSPEQVGYDLAWEDRLERADDWRHDAAVRVRDALAAEARVREMGGAG